MNRQGMTRAVVVSCIASLVVSPTIVAVGSSIAGTVHIDAILVGALMSTIFFGISGAMAIATWRTTSLKKPLLISYAVKIVLLLVVGIFLANTAIDRNAFAVSAVVSALAYLAAQTFVVTRSAQHA